MDVCMYVLSNNMYSTEKDIVCMIVCTYMQMLNVGYERDFMRV